MDAAIYATLNQYVVTHILKQPNRQITSSEALISGGLIDSFHLVDLALFIEDNFGVPIDDTELNAETFDTMEQLVTLIEQRKRAVT